MAENLNQIDEVCPGNRLFNISYSKEIVDALRQLELNANRNLFTLIIFFAPFNIAANLCSVIILLIKELRNPFNAILCIMSIDSIVLLSIRASLMYRKILAGPECNAETMTYSLALHTLVEYNSYAPIRATYTWMAAFLTFLRFRALRSKGKWEPSYSLVLSGCAFLAFMCTVAGLPMFMTNIIGYFTVEQACQNPNSIGVKTLVPYPTWSPTIYANNCLLYRLNQFVSGIIHNTVPSVLLLLLTLALTLELRKARKDHLAVAGRSAKQNDETQRAVRMLSVIAVFTLLSELPQGIVCFANTIFPVGFQYNYTARLVLLFALIQIITTSCNLVIYLVMSKSFRNAMFKRICCCCRRKTRNIKNISVTSLAKSDSNVN